MNEHAPYQLLLYYQYVPIDDPVEFAREHLELCKRLNLRGRIRVAAEGINGTVSGSCAETDQYMRKMHEDARFTQMQFKLDPVEGHVFNRISVKPRNELVTLRLQNDLNPASRTGRRLSPQEFYRELQRDDVLVIDARNSYEYDLGHFERAVRVDAKQFRDFPDWVRQNLAQHKNKPVLTYCTGGIRCEKFSAFLLEEGFQDVSQLDGGIVTYGKDAHVKGRLFQGRCYVFDQRASVEINHTHEAMVVGRCMHCGCASERFVNCANTDCRAQYVCCVDCELKQRRSCSPQCATAPRHEFDPATAGTSKSFYR